MTKTLLSTTAALMLALSLSSPALASSYESVSDETQTAIRTLLEADGYEVRKIERDDGRYEVYALKNGERFEVYVSTDLQIVRIKRAD
jgi:hypothetical protein